MSEMPILCACGCGGEVRKARFPSQHQPRFINHHQHRGEHNGNYRGGKQRRVCPVCLSPFEEWPSQVAVTCGNDACYRKWQGLKSGARGSHKVILSCHGCGKHIRRFPSQAKERNYCSRSCQSQTKKQEANGHWKGGRWRWVQSQVLQRDGYRCVICGFDEVVDVHHIIRRKAGGKDELSNLITLCPNHHRMADLGLIRVEHLIRSDCDPGETASRSHSESSS